MQTTLFDFITWIETFPPDVDMKELRIESLVKSWEFPCDAKRIYFYRHCDGRYGILVNSTGTNLPNEWFKDNEIISTFLR